MSLIKDALQVYQRGGEVALRAWYEQLSDEQKAAFREEFDQQVQAIVDVFRSYSPNVQEFVNRLAAAWNKGKVH